MSNLSEIITTQFIERSYRITMLTIAFWTLALFTANSVLGLLRALFDNKWYERKALEAGVKPNRTSLIATKSVSTLILLSAIYWIGTDIGYF